MVGLVPLLWVKSPQTLAGNACRGRAPLQRGSRSASHDSGRGHSAEWLVTALATGGFLKWGHTQNHPKLVIFGDYQWENQWFGVPIF